MAEPTFPSNRRFSEKEVALIIKRASELQEDQAPSESAGGMTLEELEQVAREAGLDPAMVRRAASDLEHRATDQRSSLLVGAPTTLRLERTLDGEVPTSELETMVLEIQRILGESGHATMLGRSLRWSVDAGKPRTVHVMVTPRNGRTTIYIEETLTTLVGGLFGGVVGGMGGGLSGAALGVGMGVMHSAPAALGLMLGALSGSYLLARSIYGRVSRSRAGRLQELMTRLAAHVADTASVPPALDRPTDRLGR